MPVTSNDTPKLNQLKALPNLISVTRLLMIPYLMWLIAHSHWIAAAFLAGVLGFSDFLDGYVARRFNKQTPLGALLDPLIDRIFVLAIFVALIIEGAVSWYLLWIVLIRDLSILISNTVRRNQLSVPVIFIGKMGTWFLFVSFALLLLSQAGSQSGLIAFSYAGIYWGVTIYWLAGLIYLTNIWDIRK
jgi:cardiolipin synthase (CMP-forming)